MLSETLAEGLAEYRIGPKIRECRRKKKLGLGELASHTGLSPSLLSKIERGHIFPTLPTLLRIAMVFGLGLEDFFSRDERSTVAVTRCNERIRLPDRAGDPAPAYTFESLNYPLHDRSFEAYLAEFPSGRDAAEPHRHDGTELVHVLDGGLSVTIGGERHVLEAGDAICFDSGAVHGYRCEGRQAARVLVTVTP